MIRLNNETKNPLAECDCPFITAKECGRPYCPYLHKSGVEEKHEKETPVRQVKSELIDDEIVVLEHHYVAKEFRTQRATTPEIRQENPTVSLPHGGYMANWDNQHQNSRSHSSTTAISYQQLDPSQSVQSQFFPINPVNSAHQQTYYSESPYLSSTSTTAYKALEMTRNQFEMLQQNSIERQPNSMFPMAQPQPNGLSAHKSNRKKAPAMYIPTPISQLEREKEERERRKLVKEAGRTDQKRGDQKEKSQKQPLKNKSSFERMDDATSLDIDRLIAVQEQLLDEMADCPERRAEQLAQLDAEKRRQKDRLDQLAEQKARRKTITLKGSSSSVSICLPPAKNAFEAKATTNSNKGEEKGRNVTEKAKYVKSGESRQKKKLKELEHESGKEEVITGNVEGKKKKEPQPTKSSAAYSQERSSKLNDCVQLVADLDKDIHALQTDIIKSSSKIVTTGKGPVASQANKPSSYTSSTTAENGQGKKAPIWRADNPCSSGAQPLQKRRTSFLEDDRFYMTAQTDPLPAALRDRRVLSSSVVTERVISELFGDEEGEGGGQVGRVKKERKRSKEPPNGDERKRRRSGTGKGENTQKRRKAAEDDEELRREQKAMADLISDDEELVVEIKKSEGRAASPHHIPVIIVPETPPRVSPKRKLDSVSSSNSIVEDSLPATPKSNCSSTKQHRVPSAQEQLHARTMAAMMTATKQTECSAAGAVNAGKSSSTNSLAQHLPKTRIPVVLSTSTSASTSSAATTTRPSSLPKNANGRKAHVPNFQPPKRSSASAPSTNAAPTARPQLVLLEPQNRKVALAMRQRSLATIYAEYAKICPDDAQMAMESAQHEEKAMLEKCHSQIGYLAGIPNLIKRLREFAAEKAGKKRKTSDSDSLVSHQSVLLGRHADEVTLGLHRAQRLCAHKASHFSELDFYKALEAEYLLSDQQLWENGYPCWVVGEDEEVGDEGDGHGQRRRRVEVRVSELDAGKNRQPFVEDAVLSRVCCRCGRQYSLDAAGNYSRGVSSDECIYHWGRAWKRRISGTLTTLYNCCTSDTGVQGCTVAEKHVTQTLRRSTLEQYVETQKPFGVGDPRSKKVYALDCEMVYTVWGPEVARLSVVDVLGELVLDVVIRPEHQLIDCNTRFSGLTPEKVLNGECDLSEARERFFELANSETILVGHSLESDLRSLRLVHRRVVDTSVVFPHRLGPPLKRALKTLAAEILQLIIQEDETGHDSKEDALVCMRIMLKKVRGGADEPKT